MRTYTIAALLEPNVEDVGPAGFICTQKQKRKCVSILHVAEIRTENIEQWERGGGGTYIL